MASRTIGDPTRSLTSSAADEVPGRRRTLGNTGARRTNLSEEVNRVSIDELPVEGGRGWAGPAARRSGPPIDQQIAQVVIVRGGIEWVGASADESIISNSWTSSSSSSCVSVESMGFLLAIDKQIRNKGIPGPARRLAPLTTVVPFSGHLAMLLPNQLTREGSSVEWCDQPTVPTLTPVGGGGIQQWTVGQAESQ
jgi:hypothetical protein